MTIDGYCTLGVDREYDLTADALIAALDHAEVDRAMIAPVDRALAVRNREGNDEMLAAAQTYRRLIPTCSANPWFGEEAITELKRAFGEGARMLVLHPFVQGFQSNDEIVWPLVECAIEARRPIYVHTGNAGSSTPWQLVDIAVRYPEGRFIMGHSGATDFWNDVSNAVHAAANLSIESSCARPFNFIRYMNDVGGSRGIMGSFAPNSTVDFEWEQMRSVMPQDEWPGIYGDNLAALLGGRETL